MIALIFTGLLQPSVSIDALRFLVSRRVRMPGLATILVKASISMGTLFVASFAIHSMCARGHDTCALNPALSGDRIAIDEGSHPYVPTIAGNLNLRSGGGNDALDEELTVESGDDYGVFSPRVNEKDSPAW
jgi:hypothetical protein